MGIYPGPEMSLIDRDMGRCPEGTEIAPSACAGRILV